MAANKLNLKNIDSPSELFEYIYKLEKDLEEKDNFIDSQIVIFIFKRSIENCFCDISEFFVTKVI